MKLHNSFFVHWNEDVHLHFSLSLILRAQGSQTSQETGVPQKRSQNFGNPFSSKWNRQIVLSLQWESSCGPWGCQQAGLHWPQARSQMTSFKIYCITAVRGSPSAVCSEMPMFDHLESPVGGHTAVSFYYAWLHMWKGLSSIGMGRKKFHQRIKLVQPV